MAAEPCFHCGEPVIGERRVTLDVDGTTQSFCCQGCRAVCQLILDENLDGFYQHRTAKPATPRTIDEREREQLRLYDHPLVQETFVAELEATENTPILKEAQLLVDGITCAACIWLLEHHLAQKEGVEQFSVNHSTRRARLIWNPGKTRLSQLLLAIQELGYAARPFEPDQAEAALQRERRTALIRLCLAGVGTMQSMMLAVPLYFGLISGVTDEFIQFFRWVSLIVATPVVFYSARPFFANAFRDLHSRHFTMDVPVALAIGLAYAASAWVTVTGGEEVYFESVCMFTFFLSLGRYIEMQARYRAGLTGAAMSSMTPAIATRRQSDRLEVVPVHQLQAGDIVEVKPGEVIPVDGVIDSGESTLNEAALTGEYLPEQRGPGAAAHAGSINGESPLSIRVERTGSRTRLSSILRILDRVQAEKPPVGRMADRVAGVFVSRILLIAPLVWIGWWLAGSDRAFDIALSVLVVTCPCALSLATPTAITSATMKLRRIGFLPTRGHTLESLNKIDTVVFDKTGTLTEGRLSLVGTEIYGDISEDVCLALAGGLEQYSEHPISQVFRSKASHQYPVSGVTNHLAGGLTGIYRGEKLVIGHADFIREQTSLADLSRSDAGLAVFLATDSRLLARFCLDDAPRPDALETVRGLQALGMHTVLLSGDRSGHVQRIGELLGIDDIRGQATPEDKLAYLRELEHRGRHVMMVGDGLNDLPVMAGAEVSVALGSAADLTQLRADAILLNGQLSRLMVALDTGQKARRVIRQNMGWALLYNLCALPLAAAGLVPPWAAALGMSLSSLVVVLNAMRLGKAKEAGSYLLQPIGLEPMPRPDTVS
ncbi:heavy metal translocating P-type ATPase [Marinobacter nanhaiticus D15-8W]|uniref:Cadmium-translocating P-type ATPase n=1 Tax=Marinobacter nanhaiticus D15-8W TaxID=626887 RepID=N6WQ56_9GAMM|nr:heavy metal translocating P-type ATPase [Marinobacter nanhaiticus]ENO13701.1 cadmium-translocating P-type ATPase [Marinobacter nanhaiticus D15-8W]BES71073.1 heavy metal translocating P-type ATPase [Marinobacter nanhaiticus D15-8W]